MKSGHIRGLLLWGSLSILLCRPVAAQDGTSKVRPSPPQKVDADLPWRKWLHEDVRYLITDQERTAARALATDQQRNDFIAAFWERRNPDPGSTENAFKEEHYRRFAYANERFAASIVPGWKTDRGRIYIIYGPPNSVESPLSPLPTEVWRYASVQGIGQKVVLTFTDKNRAGSFALTEADVDSLPRIRDGRRAY